MNRAAQQRAAIRRLTESLTTPLSQSDVEQIVVEEARRLTDAARAALCLLAPEGDMLDFVAVAGDNAALIVGLRIRLNDSLSEPVISTGRSVLLDARPAHEAGDLFALAGEAFARNGPSSPRGTASCRSAVRAPASHRFARRQTGRNPFRRRRAPDTQWPHCRHAFRFQQNRR